MATARHNLHKGDQATFLRNGGTTLFPEEIELLGEITGKRLAHLQCNCGQDSLCIARDLGTDVTGVDISDEAIRVAQKLSADSNIPAKFERSDVFDWCEQSEPGTFDIVFASYGATGWLSDLNRWAKGAARILKPGGRLVLIEFHSLMMAFSETEPWKFEYDYMGGTPDFAKGGVSDYVGDSGAVFTMGHTKDHPLPPFRNPHPAVGYCWGIADTVSAVLGAGLTLSTLTEYPYSNGWRPFPGMVEREGSRIYMPEDMPTLPMMFSLTATKP